MVSHLTDTFRDLSNLLTHSQILSVGKNQVEGLIPEYNDRSFYSIYLELVAPMDRSIHGV